MPDTWSPVSRVRPFIPLACRISNWIHAGNGILTMFFPTETRKHVEKWENDSDEVKLDTVIWEPIFYIYFACSCMSPKRYMSG